MSANLPATRPEAPLAERSEPAAEAPPLTPRQNLGVALLPLALVAFVLLAIVAAAWTFLAAVGG
jgi:hypothetical protein